ncbi:hypothetical protein [Streptomyces fagopyri]|uniref:hypothetical protein n=1 Tax=Streptomyces fagopyri TaxID=2662397 RepID=UPI0033FC06E5
MVIEAGVVAGYVVAWAVRKARRAAGRADAEVDAAIDVGMDKLHEVVVARLGSHPVLDDLAEESGTAEGEVSELTRQQLELAVTAAARKDDEFGRSVTALVAHLRAVEGSTGSSVVTGAGSAVFTGDAHTQASSSGVAFGQVAGDIHMNRVPADGQPPDPSGPGRSRP